MFSDQQKTDIRRQCGYPAYGAAPDGNMGWRFFTAYGALEYRMNNLSANEEAVVLTYLATLAGLETAVLGASDNLDSDAAASWTHNANEVADRLRLFDVWRRRLCAFMGVPPGEGLGQGGPEPGGIMDGAALQNLISKGMGVAARRLGSPYVVYRPIHVCAPVASRNRIVKLYASFNAQDERFRRVSAYGDPVWWGVFDSAYTKAGGLFGGDGGNLFRRCTTANTAGPMRAHQRLPYAFHGPVPPYRGAMAAR